jgi:hypothetical protein
VTGRLIVLEWTVISGCILAAAAIVAAFAASVVADWRRRPALTWPAAGPVYPRTPPAAELRWTLALGMSVEAVEAEIREMAHGREWPA